VVVVVGVPLGTEAGVVGALGVLVGVVASGAGVGVVSGAGVVSVLEPVLCQGSSAAAAEPTGAISANSASAGSKTLQIRIIAVAQFPSR
jgi:hypothetical protein